ncbi:MAG: acyl-CoA dehydrogenase [Armatimonadetes bacterium JP3_11]|jgi:alkylation response protein AidB-like acyl-CoA dehydrogenase|nr:MAG: acyl-CoA dehydrogenase [Armatimonadetes bacterium JP3_11]RMH10360.1 MAG: acyl-CoA dehydrogenase [Armatimonadota bacterium]
MTTKQRSSVFMIEPASPNDVFTPEDFDSETRVMGKAADDFVRNEVLPLLPEIEQAKEGVMRELDRKMGALGFTAVEVPTHYGGLDLPKTTVALIVEKLGPEPATCLTLQAHAGLAILPLVLEGTPDQKERYLPKLATGEWCGSFCLSETGSGSDALAMKTRAIPTDGGYLLNGEKMWVTNAGFADLFTVFAKLNGEQFTAFLVERTAPGVNLGREEHKIGLHGSSTRRVAFENVFVPAQNLLGEVGKAHYIALNTLNLGRFKMAASALGTGKYALEIATRYAKDRQQFGQPIANFGLIRAKLARMATHLFALESMLYRTGHLMQAWFEPIHDLPPDHPELHLRYREAASEYAGECALLKFYGTEVQYLCADEGVQIHGGYGYTEDFPIAKIFRESRVPRIYEGTNEINRLNFTQHLIRQMQRAGLPLLEEARTQASKLGAPLPSEVRPMLHTLTEQFRAATLMAFQKAWEAYGDHLREQRQEVAAAIADMAVYLYGLESILARLPKLQGVHAEAGEWMAMLFAREGVVQLNEKLNLVLSALGTDAAHPAIPMPPFNAIEIAHRLAEHVLRRDGYPIA